MIERYGLVQRPAMVARTSRVRRVLLLDSAGVIRWAMFTENFRVLACIPTVPLLAGDQALPRL